MKKKIMLGALALFMVTCATAADGAMDGFGLGIIAGEPTGLVVKKWTSDREAFDGALAWSFVDEASLQIHADYLRHVFDYTTEFEGRLPFYYGVGARMKFEKRDKGDDEIRAGIRVPLGLTYLFTEERVDLFAEVVPILDVVPGTRMGLSAAIGVRYYLK